MNSTLEFRNLCSRLFKRTHDCHQEILLKSVRLLWDIAKNKNFFYLWILNQGFITLLRFRCNILPRIRCCKPYCWVLINFLNQYQSRLAKRPKTFNQLMNTLSVFTIYPKLAILASGAFFTSGGSKGAPAGSKFFQFQEVFGKIWQNCMFAPPGGLAPPPRGNPGSPTVYCVKPGEQKKSATKCDLP